MPAVEQNDAPPKEPILLLMHHLKAIKACEEWDKLHIHWCGISSINRSGLGKNGDFGGVTFVDPKFDPGGFFPNPHKKKRPGPGG